MKCFLFQNGNTVTAKMSCTCQLLNWQADSIGKTLMDQNLVPIRKSKRAREASWRVTPEINKSIFLGQARNLCEVQKGTRLEVRFFKAEHKIKQINMIQ